MNSLELLGLVKIDILGLQCLDKLHMVENLLNQKENSNES
jgi:DNA polymerase III alpha subunit